MSWKSILVAVAAMVVGLTACSAGESPKVTTKTVTKTVEKTPQACLDALDYAEDGLTYASDALGLAGKGFDAVAAFDFDRLDTITTQMNGLTDKISATAADYHPAADECRGKS